jgi:hypothetical protein
LLFRGNYALLIFSEVLASRSTMDSKFGSFDLTAMTCALTLEPPNFAHADTSGVALVSLLRRWTTSTYSNYSQHTSKDLQRALRAKASNRDERLIFDSVQPHSKQQSWFKLLIDGWDSDHEHRNNSFTADEVLRIHDTEDEYYNNLDERIVKFLATEEGVQASHELKYKLTSHLYASIYSLPFVIPDDLYELVVAVELDHRQRFQVENLLVEEQTFSFQIVRTLGPDNRVNETITHWIAFSASYSNFLDSLRDATKTWQAKKWGYEEGFGDEQGQRWFYQTPQSKDRKDREKLKDFNESVFDKMKELIRSALDRGMELNVTFWHVSLVYLSSQFQSLSHTSQQRQIDQFNSEPPQGTFRRTGTTKEVFDKIKAWDGAFRRPGATRKAQMERWDKLRAREGLPPMNEALAQQETTEREKKVGKREKE